MKEVLGFFSFVSSKDPGIEDQWKRGWGVDWLGGFAKFMASRDQDMATHDLDGLFLSCPFGSDSKYPLDFDAAIQQLELIADGQVPSWGERTNDGYTKAVGEFFKRWPNAVMFTYFGSLTKTPRMKQLRNTPAAWLRRAILSVASVLNVHSFYDVPLAQLPIGIDQGRSIEPDSIELAFVNMLQSIGCRVAIEPHQFDTGSEHLMHLEACPSYSSWIGHGASQANKPNLTRATIQMTGKTKDPAPYLDMWQDEHVDSIAWNPFDFNLIEGVQQ